MSYVLNLNGVTPSVDKRSSIKNASPLRYVINSANLNYGSKDYPTSPTVTLSLIVTPLEGDYPLFISQNLIKKDGTPNPIGQEFMMDLCTVLGIPTSEPIPPSKGGAVEYNAQSGFTRNDSLDHFGFLQNRVVGLIVADNFDTDERYGFYYDDKTGERLLSSKPAVRNVFNVDTLQTAEQITKSVNGSQEYLEQLAENARAYSRYRLDLLLKTYPNAIDFNSVKIRQKFAWLEYEPKLPMQSAHAQHTQHAQYAGQTQRAPQPQPPQYPQNYPNNQYGQVPPPSFNQGNYGAPQTPPPYDKNFPF